MGDTEVETGDVMTDIDAAVPHPITEEEGADPGVQCTGGHPPPTTGTEEGAAEGSGAAAEVSHPEGGSILPGDTRRDLIQELMRQQSAKQNSFFSNKIRILCFCFYTHKFLKFLRIS